MQNRGIPLAAFVFTAAVISSVAFARTGQQGYDPEDLSGVWRQEGGAPAPLENDTNLLTEWSSEDPPWTPEGLAVFNANKPGKGPRRVPPALGNDPLGGANPPGLVRMLEYPRPIEMFELPDKVVQLFEWHHTWRVIWTDENCPDPWWYGHSVGRWEKDTFIVQTVGFDQRAWLDEWGTPFSDALRIEERWRRVDRDTLEFTITFDDPKTYTRPWVSDPRIFKSQPKDSPFGELIEVIFAPMDEQDFNLTIRDPAGGVTHQ